MVHAAGLSGQALGKRVFMSQAKVSRIENGRIVPSITDVELLTHALGAPPDRARELVGLARIANSEYRNGRAMSQRGHLARQREHLALEKQCRLHRRFLPTALVGATQLPAYMRRAVSNAPRKRPPEVVEILVYLHTGATLRRRVLEPSEWPTRWSMSRPSTSDRRVDRGDPVRRGRFRSRRCTCPCSTPTGSAHRGAARLHPLDRRGPSAGCARLTA